MGSATPRPRMYYGWCIVATTFCMALVSMGARSRCGVFVLPMSDEFGWNRGTISLAAAIGALVSGLSQPFLMLLKDDPAELGLLPDGDVQPLVAGQTAAARPGPLEVEHWQQSFRSTPIWQLCGGYFVCGFTIALISTHFVPFAIDRGVSATTAATAYGLMSGLNVVGVLAVGALADRGGRKNLLGLVYALRGCAYAALLLAPGAWSLWSFVVIMGFSWWATLPLTSALTAEVYGLKHLGILNGLAFTGHQIGGR